jgi:inorganic pyrophosphatase/exopolyphosphatase
MPARRVQIVNDTCALPVVLSRKKDFIPALGRALKMHNA